MTDHLQFHDTGEGRLAYRRLDGAGPTLVWLGGFGSDMDGTKAVALDGWARQTGRAFPRFDYLGHGASDGDFAEGTISRWREDVLSVIDNLTEGPLVLVGSSMGAWLACLAAVVRTERVAGLLLIAPAADFTSALIEANLSGQARRTLAETGVLPNPGGPPIHRVLIEDGARWSILPGPVPIEVAVRILQGEQDDAVPWSHALALSQALKTTDKVFTLIGDGDHRLSRPSDINRMLAVAEELSGALQP
jgi:pimeloyl-ACP methyl ester carboxylesterase